MQGFINKGYLQKLDFNINVANVKRFLNSKGMLAQSLNLIATILYARNAWKKQLWMILKEMKQYNVLQNTRTRMVSNNYVDTIYSQRKYGIIAVAESTKRN